MTNFPEGIELYNVVIALEHMDSLVISVLSPIAGPWTAPIPTSYAEPRLVTVHKMRGPWGWSDELRVLVVFGGAPLPTFEKSYITDEQISAECAIGNKLLIAERSEYSDPDPIPRSRIDKRTMDDDG